MKTPMKLFAALLVAAFLAGCAGLGMQQDLDHPYPPASLPASQIID